MAIAPGTASNHVSNRVLPGRLPRVCVALQAETTAELLAKAERAARDNLLIELRLDYLKQPATAPSQIHAFTLLHPDVTFIATCRKQQYGGKFRGTIDSELAVLSKAIDAGCRLVDFCLQAAEHAGADAVENLRARAGLILSFHDYDGTRRLDETYERMRGIPADIYKLVCTATTFADNVKLIRFLSGASGQQPIVGFCMGEHGLVSRILTLRAGGLFTFASFATGEETGPGQLDARTLRQLYRADVINRATKVYGVLGYPLAHSLSPLMHNAAFRRESINAVYLPFQAKNPEDVLNSADSLAISGLSVTQPHKSAFLERLDGIDPIAKKIGAINTVVCIGGKLYGYNTDIGAILTPLQAEVPLKGARVLVLGAGGAARAATFGLRDRGAEVFILNRTPEHAQKLAKETKSKAIKRTELKKAQFDAIINATPVGQHPKTKLSPLTADEIHARVVFDLVYNPLETELLRLARQAGARVIPGVEMFVRQGALQFEIWTGKPAPIDDMRREVLARLQSPSPESPADAR
jgi:3-dehydroquinate dehydratase/shikimate dehydrogenase